MRPRGRRPTARDRRRWTARYLEFPETLLTKAPSADLWDGQSDEAELGFTYAAADELLHLMVDEGLAPRQLAALGHAPAVIEKVATRMHSQAFKRVLPPVCSFNRSTPDRP